MLMKKINQKLFLGLVGLNVLDVVMTAYALRHGATEANPLLQSGLGIIILFKVIPLIALVYLVYVRKLTTKAERILHKTLMLAVTIYSALAVYHLYYFFQI